MDKTSLGDRMKQYEFAYKQSYPIKLPLILRLDGVHFSTNVKKWKCKKPFDEKLIDAMAFTAQTLCENIAGAKVAYVQSDEITILIRDDQSANSQPWYAKEINKILSVASAKASNAFNYKYHYRKELGWSIGLNEFAEFDCRGFVVPEHEILNCILWRQQDCSKNSIQMLARSLFSHKELEGKNGSEMQDMMMLEHGVNWNDLETYKKRGLCIIKKETEIIVPKRDAKGKVIEGETEPVIRPKWIVDKDIPIFSKDTDYINQFAKLAHA